MEIKRDIFQELLSHSFENEITLLTGARQVGKTTIMNQLAAHFEKHGQECVSFTLEDKKILSLLNEDPKNLISLIPPLSNERKLVVIIDEIQYLDDPSNFLKLIFDLYKNLIKLMVTGSSAFYIDKKFKDSLAGRKRIFNLMTLSFEEMLRFRGQGKFVAYLNQERFPLLYKSDLEVFLYEYCLYGGYPAVVLAQTADRKKLILKEIAESYIKKDVVDSDLELFDVYLQMMRLLANQTGSLVNFNKISNMLDINVETTRKYLYTMRKSFHLTLIKPFWSNKNKELKRMPKIFYYDNGLRNFFADDFSPIPLRDDRGIIFENFVFRRLLDFYGEENIRFCRTNKKQEIDFIVKTGENLYLAYEVKFKTETVRKNKYNFFKVLHPDINLQFIDKDNVFTLLPTTKTL